MLQVDICPYASDALEDAMRLAQTKSLNSYTFSDCLNYLNYVWSDIYSSICMIDAGYYSKTVQITNRLTKLPKFVKNSITVYAAQNQLDCNRQLFRQSGMADLTAPYTYHISGTDLYCPDAERTTVWLEYCPQPSQIFFTHHNRDPKLYPDGHDIERSSIYNLYKLVGIQYEYDTDGNRINEKEIDVSSGLVTTNDIATCNGWELRHRAHLYDTDHEYYVKDITDNIIREETEDGEWQLWFISCDYPYIFCSYKHSVTGEFHSGFFNKNMEWTDYNPFAWVGRNDNVEYLACHYNDKTGLGVVVRDWNDYEEVLQNTDKLPQVENAVIFVHNQFEYKTATGTVLNLEQGFWYNRFGNDYDYLKVPIIGGTNSNPDYPAAPDHNDVVVTSDNTLFRYSSDTGKWSKVTAFTEIAQKESRPRIKELGWTPDTRLVYPAPEVYRYLVARLAEKFASLNESNILGVQSELADARFAFQAFLKKDKSAWERMRNVNLPGTTDWL